MARIRSGKVAMPVKRYQDAIREALAEEMARDPRVLIMGQDIGRSGGVFRVTAGLQQRFGPERIIDTPLCESGIVGAAVGMALNGLVPVVEIQFVDFIFGAMEQLLAEAATLCYRSNGDFNVPLVLRSPMGGPAHGGLWHSQSVEGFFARVPGLKVVIPSTAYDAKGLLKAAIRDPNPVLYFEHKRAYNAVRDEVPEEDYVVPIGKAALRRTGTDSSIIAYGMTAHHALEAAEAVAKEGASVEVLDLRTIAPLDKEAILATARKTGRVLIAHEDRMTGGIGGEVASIIASEAFESLDAPIYRVAAPDVHAFPFSPPLEEYCYPGTPKVLEGLRHLLAY
jgi:2-oxoisovalerate dehydrogenase E1 component beta subunit